MNFFSLGPPEKYLLYSLTGLTDLESAPLTGSACPAEAVPGDSASTGGPPSSDEGPSPLKKEVDHGT